MMEERTVMLLTGRGVGSDFQTTLREVLQVSTHINA